MTRSQIFKKAHDNAAAWMQKQDKYKSMHSYASYAECFASCLHSVWRGVREEKEVPPFYVRYDKTLRAARLLD